MTPSEKEVLTWDLCGKAARELATQVADSGWRPDLIICLARGGLIPGGSLAYALDIKTIGSINVEFYTGEGTTLPEPLLQPPFLSMSQDLGRRALVVDDVADSGKTLEMIVDLLSNRGMIDASGQVVRFDVRTAVLYHKPRSVIRPDYSWRSTSKWISFPWSADAALDFASA